MAGFDIRDYVPVNERLSKFYESYPEGSIQSEIVELTDTRVTVKAYAFRKPDDPRPGIGHSSLGIPGPTTFTKGSEIENAETSAWGRAMAALGFEVKRGVASAEEVRNKDPKGDAKADVRQKVSLGELRDRVLLVASKHHLSISDLSKNIGLPFDALTAAELLSLGKRIAAGDFPAGSERTTTDDPMEASTVGSSAATTSQPDLQSILDATGGELIEQPEAEGTPRSGEGREVDARRASGHPSRPTKDAAEAAQKAAARAREVPA